MKIYHKSKLNMYNTVISYCKENAALIAAIPALQTSFTSLTSTVAEIKTLLKQRELNTSGISEDKKDLRERLSEQAVVIASKIYAYAVSVGNNEMKRLVDYSVSDLLRLKDEELPVVCQNILDIASANYTPLQEFKVTTELLDQFAETIALFTAVISRPRMALSKRSGSLRMIVKLFQSVDKILKDSIDKMIGEYKLSHPAFYETYWRTRIIVDPSTTPTQIRGKITNKDTGEPLNDVTIAIVENGLTMQTNADGDYAMKELTPDTYTAKISKEGFQPETLNDVLVKSGQATKVNVALVAVR